MKDRMIHFNISVGVKNHSGWVIRQKGESQNGYFKKTKYVKLSEKTNISYPHGVRNVHFSENLAYFVFFIHPFSDSPTNE